MVVFMHLEEILETANIVKDMVMNCGNGRGDR